MLVAELQGIVSELAVERELVLRLASVLWRLPPRHDHGNLPVRNPG